MEKQLSYCPVRQQAILQPDGLAIESAQQKLSYQQLDQLLDYLSIQLDSLGIKQGDRLVCIAANSIKLVLLQLTCLRSGIVFCPINPRFSKSEIELRVQNLCSDYIWYEQSTSEVPTPSLNIDFSSADSIANRQAALLIDPQQVIDIIFTSGSSGQPKAVMHNYSNHYYSALGSQAIIPLRKGDKNLLSLPLFHISGYATVVRTIIAGATLTLNEEKLSVEFLKRQKITHLSLVSTLLYHLLDDSAFKQENLDIKHLLLGGSAFSEQCLQQTKLRGFSYHLSYGLTEMSSQVATSSDSQCLHLLKYRELKFVDNEILLRGKTRFVGYFNGSIADSVIPEKQWFASKDLGKEVTGCLQIMGRKDRQFISGGENIQPEEIEAVLISFSAVKQAYVVPVVDSVFGQRPVAFIDWQDGKPLQLQLENYLHCKLTAYKRPTSFFQMPVKTGLKVSQNQLQQIVQAALKEPDRA